MRCLPDSNSTPAFPQSALVLQIGSLLDGACDVEKLVAHVDSIGQKAVAITDHGNIYGAVHFFEAAKAKGIKPILGCELYICPRTTAFSFQQPSPICHPEQPTR